MSFQHAGRCFSTQVDAWGSLAAVEVGSIKPVGGALYVVDVVSVTTAGITYELTDMLTSSTVSFLSAPSMQPCALLDWQDGLELGWGVGGLWIAVAAVLFVAWARRGT